MMKLAKASLAATYAGLLILSIVGSPRHVYAQDAAATDENIGSWNGPDANSAEQSIGDVKKHALSIKGCWAGTVTDTGDGAGAATFQFFQNSTRKKLMPASTFKFEWADSAFARGPLKGTVTSTGFSFKGNAGTGCEVSGNGTGDASAMTGTVVFVGACANTFQDVTFSIAPGCM